MYRHLFTYFVLILLFLNTESVAQVNPDLQLRLDKTLDSMRIRIKSAALSGGMVLPDGNVWTSASGMASQNPVTQARPDQLLLIGSVTKTIISAAILNLAQNGQLALNDKISKWIEPLPHIDTNITITHLLRHQSGIYDILESQALNLEMITHQDVVFSPWDIINRYLQAPLFAPGAQWSYSNTNYFLLGIIIEKVTGQTYYQYIRSQFLDAHQLTSFAIPAFENMEGEVCHVWLDLNGDQLTEDAHDFYSNYIALNSVAGAAGGYYANSADLARWIYKFMRGEIVNSAWVAEAQKTVYASGVPNGTYGLGLMKKSFLGFTGFGHGGDLGYSASAWYFPEKEVSIAVLNNDAKNISWNLVPVVQALLKTYNTWAATTSTIDDNDVAQLRLYPNPAQAEITLNLADGLKKANHGFSICDSRGQIFWQSSQAIESVEPHLLKIDVSHLPAGQYYVWMHQAGHHIPVKSFIKS
ncbi:MAG TPA: serine hydrolase [Saprospiraceae bacterium]|nr:serine hydrolase [Saprospiraceae bacterium]